MLIRFQPLELAEFPQPRPGRARKPSQFKATWPRTLELLEHELEQLCARDVVIRAGFTAAGLRIDGWPKAEATAAHPAVILQFLEAVNNKPLSFPCDRFLTYRENIRAIALSLEALRTVDRFGVTRSHEQYSGFRQLEAPQAWTIESAADFMAAKSLYFDAAQIIDDHSSYVRAYRECASIMHPDKVGANPHEWHLLQQARVLLEEHHAHASA